MPAINVSFQSLAEIEPYKELGTYSDSNDLYVVAEHIGHLMAVYFETKDVVTQLQRNQSSPRDIPIDEAVQRNISHSHNLDTPTGFRAIAVNRRRPQKNYRADRGSVISYAEIADFDRGKSVSRIRTFYSEARPGAIRVSLSNLIFHATVYDLSARIHLPETEKVFKNHPKTNYS